MNPGIPAPDALSPSADLQYAASWEVCAVDVLQLDVSGRPQAWITTRDAAAIYANDGVAWTLGEPCQVLRGGLQRRTGLQSRIEVHPIIAVRGAVPSRAWRHEPALSNPKLFARDVCICKVELYSSIQVRKAPGAGRETSSVRSNKPIRAWASAVAKSPRISSANNPSQPPAAPPVSREGSDDREFMKVST